MTFKRTLLSILALSLCLLCPYHIASGETAPLRGGDPELTFVIDRSYSTTTIKLPVLCRNERAQGLCRRLTGYFARRFERELILLSNELINLEEGEFQHVRLHGEQSVYLFFLKNTEAPLTTLYAVSFQYLPNVPERRMVETFNFDREEERNVPFEELFEDPELASMLVARYMEKAYAGSKSPLFDVLVTATEYRPSNFIVVHDGLRFFFAPGIIDFNTDELETLKVPLDELTAAGPHKRWWPSLNEESDPGKNNDEL